MQALPKRGSTACIPRWVDHSQAGKCPDLRRRRIASSLIASMRFFSASASSGERARRQPPGNFIDSELSGVSTRAKKAINPLGQEALSHLSSDEKFFSIDEFGPFSIRIRGGRALVPGDQIRTIPQRQRSRGSLICTAALELSSNQILHFYSKKKNSQEMIKLLRRLIIRYRGQKRIFVSWDSASWHASKMLYKDVNEINSDAFRWRHKTPIVELIPLPSGAQFLNVIESVFSGMARAILHNSNYRTVDECKSAINMYFADRNRAFLERPRRAGNKIWGKERVEAVFKEENNCKDPRWR
jgi:hypothetical protein